MFSILLIYASEVWSLIFWSIFGEIVYSNFRLPTISDFYAACLLIPILSLLRTLCRDLYIAKNQKLCQIQNSYLILCQLKPNYFLVWKENRNQLWRIHCSSQFTYRLWFSTNFYYNWVHYFLAEFPAALSRKLEFNLTLAYDDINPAVINHQLLIIYSTTTIYDPPVDKL